MKKLIIEDAKLKDAFSAASLQDSFNTIEDAKEYLKKHHIAGVITEANDGNLIIKKILIDWEKNGN